MKFYYIGVAEDVATGTKFIVRSKHHSICRGYFVVFTTDKAVIYAEVIHAAYVPSDSTEEAILSEFGEIHDVDEIYQSVWKKKEEVTEYGY